MKGKFLETLENAKFAVYNQIDSVTNLEKLKKIYPENPQ